MDLVWSHLETLWVRIPVVLHFDVAVELVNAELLRLFVCGLVHVDSFRQLLVLNKGDRRFNGFGLRLNLFVLVSGPISILLLSLHLIMVHVFLPLNTHDRSQKFINNVQVDHCILSRFYHEAKACTAKIILDDADLVIDTDRELFTLFVGQCLPLFENRQVQLAHITIHHGGQKGFKLF